MGTVTLGIAEARNDLSAVINRAAYGREVVVLQSRGRPKVVMMSYEDYLSLEAKRRAERNMADSVKAEQLAVLARADALRQTILARRGGKPLEDSVDVLNRLRQERVDELIGLC